MRLFRRNYTMTLNRVHDTIAIKEGSETLKLTVNGDAMRMVAGLEKARQNMQTITEDTDPEKIKEIAEHFATVIFGPEQAARLMEFYANDAPCVVSVCGQYFKARLADKIAEVQKKAK